MSMQIVVRYIGYNAHLLKSPMAQTSRSISQGPIALEYLVAIWMTIWVLMNIDAKHLLYTGHRLFSCELAKVFDEPLQPEKAITKYSI